MAGLNSFLKIFMPKNRVFYELFEKVANNVEIMGSKLKDVVAEPDFDKRAALITQLEDLEHANDEFTHNLFTELVNPNDTGMQKFAELIEQGAAQVKIAVVELRDMKNMRSITEALVKINSIENQADDVFDFSIEKLFATEDDAKEVIKKREIYQVMEIVTDKCEDASNVIESIIIKYA